MSNGFLNVLSTDEGTEPREFLSSAAEKMGIKLAVGIDGSEGSFEAGALATRNSQTAAGNAYFFGMPVSAYMHTAPVLEEYPSPQTDSLSNASSIEELVLRTCSALRTMKNPVIAAARQSIYALASLMAGEIKLYGVSYSLLPADPRDLVEWVEQWITLDEVEKALLEEARIITSKVRNRGHINAAIRYIDENLFDYSLSLPGIAENLMLNTAYLCTLFKNETGKTLVTYITDQRMEKARQLLSGNRLKVQEVAAKVGYGDTAWFINRFKRAYGMTPNEYKEKYGR